MSLAWIYLILAVVFEIIWGLSLKSTDGFKKLIPSIITIAACAAVTYFIAVSVTVLPIAVVYPLWTGLGGVGVAVFSVVFYKEKLSATQICCVFIVIAGAVGLKLSGLQ